MSWQRRKKNRRRMSARQSDKGLLKRLSSVLGPRLRRGLVFSVLAMATLGSGWQLQDWLAGMDSLTLRQVRVESSFEHISRDEVRSLLAPYAGQRFFDLDVTEIKQRLQQQPWIRQATVRRQWPDGLEITLLEQQAVARWGERGLLNADASLFSPAGELSSDLVGLPRLNGVVHSERLMLTQWRDMGALLQPLGLKITAMRLDERRSWRLQLDNGLRLMLGKGQDMRRLQRFVAFYPRLLAAQVAEVGVVDLRYPNGIVLRWRTAQGADAKLG